MDPLLSSTDLSSGKAANFASGLLSSLNSLFGTNVMGSDVFSSLLAEDQEPLPVTLPTPTTSPVHSTQNTTLQDGSNGNENQNSDATPIGALKSLVIGLHRIIRKLNNTNDTSTSGNSNNTAANNPTNAAPSTNAVTQTQAVSATGNDSSDPPTSTDTSGSNSNTSAPQTLAGILADLTALMKFMEKRLPAAQASSSDTNVTQTPLTPDDQESSAADPLTQLLSLMQLIQRQLTASAGDPLSTATATTTGGTTASGDTSSSLATALQDLLQIQKDIKGLLASFQDGGTSNDPVGTGNAGGSVSNDISIPPANNLLATTTSQTSSDKPSLATADDFFGLFGGLFSGPSVNAPATNVFPFANVNALATNTDVADDTSSDLMPQNSDASSSGGGAPNLNALNTNAPAFSAPADGAQSVNPYTFASQLSATRAANGGTTGLPDAVEQVILQLNRGVKDGNEQMTIQLHPAELGKISIKLDISSDGKVQGTVVASNPATLDMLHKDVRSLERALQEAGLRADSGSLQFSMSGQSGNQTGQATSNPGSTTASDGATSSDVTNTSIDVSSEANEVYYLTPGRVNLKV